MAVDPDRVKAVPVSMNKAVMNSTRPVSGTVEIIRLITDADAD